MGEVGHGVKVELGSDTIGEVMRISASGATRDEIDVSSADSENMIKELLGGMVTPGKITVAVRLNAAAAGYLETHFATGGPENCAITLKSGNKFDGDGFMSGLDPVEVSHDGDVTQSFTFTLTELLDFTPKQ